MWISLKCKNDCRVREAKEVISNIIGHSSALHFQGRLTFIIDVKLNGLMSNITISHSLALPNRPTKDLCQILHNRPNDLCHT